MKLEKQELVVIKSLKNLRMLYEPNTHEIIIQKLTPEGLEYAHVVLSKNEIFPVIRGLISATQRFYRRKQK